MEGGKEGKIEGRRERKTERQSDGHTDTQTYRGETEMRTERENFPEFSFFFSFHGHPKYTYKQHSKI